MLFCMLTQAKVEAKALMETVAELRSVSTHEDFSALRQQLVELQRAHDEDLHGVGAVDTGTAAELPDDEVVASQPRRSQQQQDAAPADSDEHTALAASQATADAVLDLRAYLEKLADHVPAVQRLRTGRVATAF